MPKKKNLNNNIDNEFIKSFNNASDKQKEDFILLLKQVLKFKSKK